MIAWSEGKRVCCERTPYDDLERVNLYTVLFYVYPDAFSHHFRTVHKKKVTDEEGIKCAKLTQDIVAAETYRNLTDLSKERQRSDPASQLYKKCIVTSPRTENDEIVLFAIREKEAAKLVALFLWHKGLIKKIEQRDEGYPIHVNSSDFEFQYEA